MSACRSPMLISGRASNESKQIIAKTPSELGRIEAPRYDALTMNKQHYYFKLIPPRPTFAMDLTDKERALMEEHGAYCAQQFAVGKLIAYGPVLAPDGAFGVAILEVADEAEARQFGENDPSVLAGMNRFEFYPMRVAAARAKS